MIFLFYSFSFKSQFIAISPWNTKKMEKTEFVKKEKKREFTRSNKRIRICPPTFYSNSDIPLTIICASDFDGKRNTLSAVFQISIINSGNHPTSHLTFGSSDIITLLSP